MPGLETGARLAEAPVFSLRLLTRSYRLLPEVVTISEQLKAFATQLRVITSLSWSALKGSPRTANGSENIPCEQLSVRLPATVPELKDVMVFDSEGEEPLDELQGTGTGARSSFCSLTHASTFMPTSAPPTQSTRVPCAPA
jgi:hypothetical protein